MSFSVKALYGEVQPSITVANVVHRLDIGMLQPRGLILSGGLSHLFPSPCAD